MGKAYGTVSGSGSAFSWQLGGSARRAGDYEAPAGTFGKLKLASDVTVLDAGVRDQSLNGYLAWRGAAHTSAFAKVDYRAQDLGRLQDHLVQALIIERYRARIPVA